MDEDEIRGCHLLLIVLIICNFLYSRCYASPTIPNAILSQSIFVPEPVHPLIPQLKDHQKRFVKILSIDGGGVKSIIPAEVLKDLEARLPKGKHLSDYFDIIAGTSAGGIIALMLATPDINGKPKYSASFISTEIADMSKEVFSRSLWQIIKSGNGWFDAKYDEKVLQEKLGYYFKDTLLSQTLSHLIVPSYGIERGKSYFFKTNRARVELEQNCFLRDLAYATSAAPTYFRPGRLINKAGEVITLVDGGISANNPTLAAAVHALELYGNDIELFIVSIGTGTNYHSSTARSHKDRLPYGNVKTSGKLGWAKEIISLLISASDEVVDYEMYYVLNFGKPQYYFRFQAVVDPEYSDLDNVQEKNLVALKTYARHLIQKNDKTLDYIAEVLSKGYFPNPTENRRNKYAYQ